MNLCHRWGIAMLTLTLLGEAVSGGERHPPTPYRSGRSETLATQGMVATSHPLAAQIGLDILRRGGNAVDAAIATNAALGLMEPMSCGIGGDLFAIVWDAKTKKIYGLNANGAAPRKASRDVFAARGMTAIPTTGPLSWSVPGCVDGWEELRRRFGSKPLADLLAPSVEYATNGFPVTPVIAGYWKNAEAKLRAGAGATAIFLRDGSAPVTGEVFRNPALAETYRRIGKDGRDAFYRGAIAKQLAAFSAAQGGLLTAEDLAAHRSTWVDPVSTTYRGHEIWELPPPGQGIAALQMLNLLEAYDLKSMGPNSPEFWHLFVEAKKLAYADRAAYYADPAFAQVPVAELISKAYADLRRKRIRRDRAAVDLPPGDPRLGKADTVYLCVVDKDRNCVSLIQSLYHGFGSGRTCAELGFPLQNRGCLFALDPKHANCLEPGKKPFHTIIPALATKDGQPWFVFGVMGGDMQPQGHVQVLIHLIDFGMNVQEAGEAPRIEHVGSATPTGLPGEPDGGTLRIEQGMNPAIIAALKKRGHQIEMVKTNGGGYQGIRIDAKTNVLHGGTEYRKDGAAVGY